MPSSPIKHIGDIDLVRDAIDRPERRTRFEHGVGIIERVGIDPDRVVIGPHLQGFGLGRFQRDEIGRTRGEDERHQFLVDIGRHADQPAVEQGHEIGAILPGEPGPDPARGRQETDARVADDRGQRREVAFGVIDIELEDILVDAGVHRRIERLVLVRPGEIERPDATEAKPRAQPRLIGEIGVHFSSRLIDQPTCAPYSSRDSWKSVTTMVRRGR